MEPNIILDQVMGGTNPDMITGYLNAPSFPINFIDTEDIKIYRINYFLAPELTIFVLMFVIKLQYNIS